MRLQDYPTEPQVTATVLQNERITDPASAEEVRELVIEVEQSDFRCHVGQCVGVLTPGPHQFGHKLHHRLYSVASMPPPEHEGKPELVLCVKRCDYIDDYSGEEFHGVSSNYLCDINVGATLSLTGPFGVPFEVPENHHANLLLIGMGTGIAPFRGLVKHIYQDIGDWQGKIRLLYGARSGLELLYMNEERDDFALYYDEETFEAIKALSPRPEWADPIAWDYALEQRAEEIAELLESEDTYVYVAGLAQIRDTLDKLFGMISGSDQAWEVRKAALIEKGRWVELLY